MNAALVHGNYVPTQPSQGHLVKPPAHVCSILDIIKFMRRNHAEFTGLGIPYGRGFEKERILWLKKAFPIASEAELDMRAIISAPVGDVDG